MNSKIDIKISLDGKRRYNSIYIDGVKHPFKTLDPNIKFKVMCELDMIKSYLMNNLTQTLK